MKKKLTHIDESGNSHMVDVGGKQSSRRVAVACGSILMSKECFHIVAKGRAKKGDVLGVAQIAGIMATKHTADLIPLCHTLILEKSDVTFKLDADACRITATCAVCCEGKTGVEMEALTGVSVALLTIYDMCKAVDKQMVMTEIHLLEKQGGKSGDFHFEVQGSEELKND